MKQPIKIDPFNGHLILLCKGHYKGEDFFEGLKMIWAIRCGYDFIPTEGDRVLEYIADNMFETIIKCKEINTITKMKHLMDVVHKDVSNQAFYKPKNMTPIKALIYAYGAIFTTLQINEGGKPLIILPKPMKQVFNRILRGNGRYGDYKSITQYQH